MKTAWVLILLAFSMDAQGRMIRDIVFSAAPDGDEDIYVMSPDGNDVRRLTQISGPGITNRTPEWSPDGSQIAFQSNRDGPREIYILTVATREIRRVTHTDGMAMHPAWSPDARQLVYVSDRGDGNSLFIIDVDGSNERRISPPGTQDKNIFNPSWIPDGTRIAFMLQGKNGEPDSLWTSKLDGSDIRRLTTLKAMSSRPKWLSDGETIIFHSNRFGNRLDQPEAAASKEDWFDWWNQFEILTMNRDGGSVRRLTTNQLRDLHPDG